jgi:hypothetical protein
MKLKMDTYDVLRILSAALLTKMHLVDLLADQELGEGE